MLNTNTTNEVATILYGEQLSLWDFLDQPAAEPAQVEQTTSEPVQEDQPAINSTQANSVLIYAKSFDDCYTLVAVIALLMIELLVGKWKPP